MKRILIVDDEPTIRELIAEALRDAGYHVETAANGAEALQLLHTVPPPDAIVLDLMMPRLDGMTFVERMRLSPRLSAVPIVLVTAAYGAARSAEHIGAHVCITKPFELDELVDAVTGVIDQPRSGRAGADRRFEAQFLAEA